jgi:hypothetical protein
VRRARALVFKATASPAKRKLVSKLGTSASDVYQQMWTALWTYQSTITSCTNLTLCTNVDISANVKTFQAGSQRMVDLLDQAVRVLRQVSGNRNSGASLVRSMRKAHASNIAESARIPATQSTCNG